MITYQIYSLSTWLSVEPAGDPAEVAEQLAEVLGEGGMVSNIERVEDEKAEVKGRLSFSFALQYSFPASDCIEDEPLGEAVAACENELKALLAKHFKVISLEMLDDAATKLDTVEYED
jgi:hypothetical protein